LATELAHQDGGPDAGLGEVRCLPDGGGWLCSTHGWWISQNVGPTGSGKSDWATRWPSLSTEMGSWGSGRFAGPKMTLQCSVTSKVDWWQGHSRWWVWCSYSATGHPTWVQILEYATMPSCDQSLRSGSSLSSFGLIRMSRTAALACSLSGCSLASLSPMPEGRTW